MAAWMISGVSLWVGHQDMYDAISRFDRNADEERFVPDTLK
jgi:hypothetical protein